MFSYDAAAPLNVQERGVQTYPTTTVRDIRYDSPLGGQVPAFLVEPVAAETGPFAGLIYMHPGQGDRSMYLPEAQLLAQQGVVSVLINAPYLRVEFGRPDFTAAPNPQKDAHMYRQLVVDLRRAVDLLLARPDVDPARIGFVGHSLGATWGGVLAGVEQRIRAYVLMAGYASFTDWHRTSQHPMAVGFRSRFASPAALEEYLAEFAAMDGGRFLGQAAPANLLLQFARQDEFVDADQAQRYIAAASEPKRVEWYDTDHLFTLSAEAADHRLQWLAAQLGLGMA